MASANSAEFETFLAANLQLRKSLLPSKFSDIGQYSSRVLDRTRGFAVLYCAEVEHYLERSAEIVAERAFRAWRENGVASRPLVSLVGLMAPLAYWGKGTGSAGITTIIGKCVAQYNQVLMNNNGVKIANIENILPPIGIEVNALDQIWLSTLDSFARDRGEYAHVTGLTSRIDPKTKMDETSIITDGLEEVDRMFVKALENI